MNRLKPLIWRREAVLVLGTLLIALISAFTSAGAYLDLVLAYEPLMKIRAKAGFAPKLDQNLRLFIVDDRTLAKLGRLPTFSEWQTISKQLFANGYERVLLVGTFNLSSEIGEPVIKHEQGFLGAGALEFPYDQNLRAVDPKLLPSGLMAPCAHGCEEMLRGVRPLTHFLGSPEQLWPLVDAFGSLNLVDDGRLPLAYRAADGRILPHLALLAAPGLAVRDGALVNRDGEIAAGFDGTTLVDFASMKEILAQSLPVSAFYTASYAAISAELSDKLREKIRGGRVAVLAPEAYTGARFIDTYLGQMPAYAATVSLASSVLHRDLLVAPFTHHTLLWPVIFALLGFALWRGPKPTLYATGLTAAVTIGVAAVFLIAGGWYLRLIDVLLADVYIFGFNAIGLVVALVADKLKLRRDLELGQATQSIYLPEAMEGTVGFWRYQFQFQPYGPMSGDWIMGYRSPPEVKDPIAVFALGDVVGKGPAAALNTATIATIWHQQVRFWDQGERPNIERLVKNLNAAVFTTFRGRQNTALTIAVIVGDTVEMAVFGAAPWAVARAAGGLEWMRTPPSRALGDLPEVGSIKILTANLGEGDLLFASSDGVIDSLVSRTRFKRSMAGVPLSASDADFTLVAQNARAAAAGEVLPDDQTIVMVRRMNAAEIAALPTRQKTEQNSLDSTAVGPADGPVIEDAPPPSAADVLIA